MSLSWSQGREVPQGSVGSLVLSIIQCPPDSGRVFRLIRLSVGADALWRAGILRQGEPAPRGAHTHPQPRTACASRETGRLRWFHCAPSPRTTSTNYIGDRTSVSNYRSAAMAPEVRRLKGTLVAATWPEAGARGVCGLPMWEALRAYVSTSL